jgi:hypothetical protein
MARESPAQKIARISRVVHAWEAHAAHTVFSRKTLSQFRSAVQPSYDARAEIDRLQRQLSEAINRRTAADERSLRLLRSVVFAVLGHPDHAEDSVLYGSMGYVRRSARRRKPRRQRRKR